MFSDPYIEAWLVDEELADAIWTLWDRGLISDDVAACAWTLIVFDVSLCRRPTDVL